MAFVEKSDRYRATYGRGYTGPVRVDYSLCCEAVSDGPWRTKQCARKRGHGPDEAYCKQHDPLAIKAKRDAADAARRAEREAREKAHRLAAAAPEMLEALRALLERYVDLANSGDAGFWDPEEEAEVIAARAAIAKAEGEP